MPTVLIAGASGMLGYTLLRHLSDSMDTHGTVRATALPAGYQLPPHARLHTGIDVAAPAALFDLIEHLRPDAVVNCIGLIKQLEPAHRPAAAIALNALFPHELAAHCSAIGSRLIHISTDCVFSGTRGRYSEADPSDADDLYGRSKRLGEVDYGGHLTLRTSLIGHELAANVSLIDWFLSQTAAVRGYAGAIFSGLPTVEIARVLARFVLPRPELQGLYHLSVAPIDKDSLLRRVASAYGHAIPVARTECPRIDRSLDSTRFRETTGYCPPSWEALIDAMHRDYLHAYAPVRTLVRENP